MIPVIETGKHTGRKTDWKKGRLLNTQYFMMNKKRCFKQRLLIHHKIIIECAINALSSNPLNMPLGKYWWYCCQLICTSLRCYHFISVMQCCVCFSMFE